MRGNRIIRGILSEQVGQPRTASGAIPTPQACSPAPYACYGLIGFETVQPDCQPVDQQTDRGVCSRSGKKRFTEVSAKSYPQILES